MSQNSLKLLLNLQSLSFNLFKTLKTISSQYWSTKMWLTYWHQVHPIKLNLLNLLSQKSLTNANSVANKSVLASSNRPNLLRNSLLPSFDLFRPTLVLTSRSLQLRTINRLWGQTQFRRSLVLFSRVNLFLILLRVHLFLRLSLLPRWPLQLQNTLRRLPPQSTKVEFCLHLETTTTSQTVIDRQHSYISYFFYYNGSHSILIRSPVVTIWGDICSPSTEILLIYLSSYENYGN